MATWVTAGAFGVVLEHTTTRDEGDFGIDTEPAGLAARRRAVVDHPWVWLRQVHGSQVVVVTAENAAAVAGTEADALVTAEPELVLAVQTADCLPITFHSPEGVIGVAHAGWRGLEAGVVDRTIEAMGALGATIVQRRVGPFICGACYEFGAADLDRLAHRFGDRVRSVTSEGTSGLELGEVLRSSVGESEVALAGVAPYARGLGPCTAEHGDRYYSYRARGEVERMATVIWRERSYDDAMSVR